MALQQATDNGKKDRIKEQLNVWYVRKRSFNSLTQGNTRMSERRGEWCNTVGFQGTKPDPLLEHQDI